MDISNEDAVTMRLAQYFRLNLETQVNGSVTASDDPIIYDYSIYYSICYNQSIIVFYNSFIKTELREWTNLFKIN